MGSGASSQYCPSDAKLRRTMLIKTHNAMAQSKVDQDIPAVINSSCRKNDSVGSGSIAAAEFEQICQTCGVHLRQEEIMLLQKRFDVGLNHSQSDQLSYVKLLAFLRNDVSQFSATPPSFAPAHFPTSPKKRMEIDNARFFSANNIRVADCDEQEDTSGNYDEEIREMRQLCEEIRETCWLEAERLVADHIEQQDETGEGSEVLQQQQQKKRPQKLKKSKHNQANPVGQPGGFQPETIIQYIIVDTQVKDSKGKSFSKGRMAAQISHVSVMAVNTFLKEESNITKEYVEETRGQMTTVVFKLKSGVSFTQIVKVLDTANKNAVSASASASASNPAGKADIFRHVVWNENPEKVDVAMALRPVLYSDYQIVQDELRQLLGLY